MNFNFYLKLQVLIFFIFTTFIFTVPCIANSMIVAEIESISGLVDGKYTIKAKGIEYYGFVESENGNDRFIFDILNADVDEGTSSVFYVDESKNKVVGASYGPDDYFIEQQVVKQQTPTSMSTLDNDSNKLVVKGMYIGMSESSAKIVLENLCGDSEIIQNDEIDYFVAQFLNFDDALELNWYSKHRAGNTHRVITCENTHQSVFINKETNKVTLIMLKWRNVYSAEGMEFEDFVKEFIDGYKIPKMTGSVFYNKIFEKQVTRYSYLSPDGYKIVINSLGILKIIQSSSDAERKFD